jgi:hypothetical protein
MPPSGPTIQIASACVRSRPTPTGPRTTDPLIRSTRHRHEPMLGPCSAFDCALRSRKTRSAP